jgi:hypothetical protein
MKTGGNRMDESGQLAEEHPRCRAAFQEVVLRELSMTGYGTRRIQTAFRAI